MAFVTRPLNEIPKRVGRPAKYDANEATALLQAISVQGQTATDGETHSTRESAMKAAASAKRLLSHVLPEDARARTRVFPEGEGFAWVIFLASPEKAASKSAKK